MQSDWTPEQEEAQTALKQAYKHFFRSSYNIGQALAAAAGALPDTPDVERFVRFIRESERGVLL